MNLTLQFRGHLLVLEALKNTGQYAAQGQARAINRTASRTRTQAVKRIGKRMFLKAAYLREHIEIRRQALPTHLQAILRTRARETRLDRFPNKQVYDRAKNGGQKRAGVRVQIKRGRPARLIKSAFMVPVRRGKQDGAGGMGIAVRVDVLRKLGYPVDTGSLGGKGSRKYEVLHTTSIRDLFRDEIEREGLGDELQAYYEAQTDAEIKRAIVRARR
ncbi:MAG TPA: hypothetical protein VFS13_00590 [Steroidobacteraceae bacterium]|nr:hypothetical protein [Steroidobacteraceae bacterium]